MYSLHHECIFGCRYYCEDCRVVNVRGTGVGLYDLMMSYEGIGADVP